jgi:hypothetical protein
MAADEDLARCHHRLMEDGHAGPHAEISGRMLDFLNRLDAARIHYTLLRTRLESLMVDISLPGWRWEVEFVLDGSPEVERYKSVAGAEGDPALPEELLAEVDRSWQSAACEGVSVENVAHVTPGAVAI